MKETKIIKGYVLNGSKVRWHETVRPQDLESRLVELQAKYRGARFSVENAQYENPTFRVKVNELDTDENALWPKDDKRQRQKDKAAAARDRVRAAKASA